MSQLKKRNLVDAIESLEAFQNPKIELEQYTTDAVSTADLIYFIGVDNHDLVGNLVVDLGAGTGRLGISSLLFGALGMIAIEKDEEAIEILKKNAEKVGVSDRILIKQLDIAEITKDGNLFQQTITEIDEEISNFEKELVFLNQNQSSFYNKIEESEQKLPRICITNPPFGIHQQGADRPFIMLGTALCDKMYSIHYSGKKNREFIERLVQKLGWKVENIYSQKLMLKGTYFFHTKPQKEILTDVFLSIPDEK
jgi:predicted RNA methylase